MQFTIPFIAALIGWFTNYLAVKMLFSPKNPIKIGPFTIQGVFPKRQYQLAEKIGTLVADQLLSTEDLKSIFLKEKNLEGVYKILDEKIDLFLREKLLGTMPMLSMFINDSLIESVKKIMSDEMHSAMPDMIDQFTGGIKENMDIKKIVQDKVATFSFDKLEEVFKSIISKELRFIEIMGAVLGFAIGVLQLILINIG